MYTCDIIVEDILIGVIYKCFEIALNVISDSNTRI